MIAAGGDTTSMAFAAALFYLSRGIARYTKLANEVRSTFTSPEDVRRGKLLSSCSYLHACIEEALRLSRAAPGVLWREACEGGAVIDGVFIPAVLCVGTCTYALRLSEQYFDTPSP